MKQRAIDLQLIKPVEGSSNLKGKITLNKLQRELLKDLNVPFYDVCCDINNNPIGSPVRYTDDENNLEYFNGEEWVEIEVSGGSAGALENKGTVDGAVDFDLGEFNHFTLSLEDDITANFLNIGTPAYIIIEVTHVDTGTTITNLPGVFATDFEWASEAGSTTILGGTYNGFSWSWVSSIFGDSISPTFDVDADAFFTAANITDNTQKTAVNTFVTTLKGDSIWSKMKAIYPLVGGTASSHKYNLKDPRDLDAAFRLTFTGGIIHNAQGVTGGTGKSINTHFNPSVNSTLNSTHASAYTNSPIGFGAEYYISADDGSTAWLLATVGGSLYYRMNDSSSPGLSTAISDGFLLFTRTSSSLLKIYADGTTIGTNNSASSAALPNAAVTYLFYDDITRPFQFFSIGDGLDDGEVAALNSAVVALQTALSRV